MRVRFTNSPTVSYLTKVYTWQGTGPKTYYGQFTWSNTAESSRIHDEGGRKAMIVGKHGDKVQKMRFVRHQTLTSKVVSTNSTVRTSSNLYADTNGCAILANEKGKSNIAWAMLDVIVKNHLTSAFDGHYDRWQVGKPSMTTRANMTVFLYELRDIKRMLEVLPPKHFNLRNWQDVLKYVNSQHLNYNFGWKPFLKDLKQAAEGILSFTERLEKFLSRANTDVRRRVSPSPETVNVTERSTGAPGGGWDWRYRLNGLITRHSVFHYSYELPAMGPEELRRRAWLDTLGLNPTVANVWRVIPFSFVVDWFLNISKFLDQASTDWVEPWIQLLQACSSVKHELTMTSRMYLPTTGASIDVGTAHYTCYTREVGAPNFNWSTLNLDADKIRLGASLVAARIL